MNARRFVARTSREALAAARQAFGDDAVVLSTRPCPEGVEVLAMAGEGLAQIEQAASAMPRVNVGAVQVPAAAPSATTARPARPAPAAAPRVEPSVDDDVSTLTMSTLSFQDYVRERMLKRRDEALRAEAAARAPAAPSGAAAAERSVLAQRMATPAAPQRAALRDAPVLADMAEPAPSREALAAQAREAFADRGREAPSNDRREAASMDRREAASTQPIAPAAAAPRMPVLPAAPREAGPSRRDHEDMLAELRQVKGLIEERFGALAFMEKLQRQPGQALLAQKLLDCGFSPALVRKIAEALPADAGDTIAWATSVLERNLTAGEGDAPLEDEGGVFALIGATGVGKTTSTAKIAAAFAARHGAAHLGLITLDAYRVGAQEQLRTYGRILGVPVHTAHDRASLEDLLDLLSVKRMVLIDTAGMAQRDTRTRELLEMLSHRAIKRLLVVNAASQGETIEDVIVSYRASTCHGLVLSKVDEAVKIGPALDALIRHKLRICGVANGQRVPEDWHRLSASALVQRALRGGGSAAWKLDTADVSLVFSAPSGPHAARAARAALGPNPSTNLSA
jgi:flagellar biosynthesis protein FlhF